VGLSAVLMDIIFKTKNIYTKQDRYVKGDSVWPV